MRQRTGGPSSTALRNFGRAALRFTAGFVFIICLMLTLRSFGVPVPGPLELLDKFKDVSKLAETLS